jgi:hypothetical protein
VVRNPSVLGTDQVISGGSLQTVCSVPFIHQYYRCLGVENRQLEVMQAIKLLAGEEFVTKHAKVFDFDDCELFCVSPPVITLNTSTTSLRNVYGLVFKFCFYCDGYPLIHSQVLNSLRTLDSF